MAKPFRAGIPPDLDLDSGYVIQFTALNAATGAVMTTVNISNATLTVQSPTGGTADELFTFDDPLWISLPADDTSA